MLLLFTSMRLKTHRSQNVSLKVPQLFSLNQCLFQAAFP